MYTSECSLSRPLFEPFLRDRKIVLEMGAGGDVTVPHALPFDMVQPYTVMGGVKQVFQGHCDNLSFFCDESVDAFSSSHLLEDFSYEHLRRIITEWRRVLKPGGVICINCPCQQTFLAHCAKTGQGTNDAHHEQNFSLETFRSEVLAHTGPWKEIFVEPKHGNYSWLLVIEKA